jgi:hypothetical protein
MATPTNKQRCTRAHLALLATTDRQELDADPKSAVTDILTDLQHWCHRNEIQFDTCLRIARDHFSVESGE